MAWRGVVRSFQDLMDLFADGSPPPQNTELRDVVATFAAVNDLSGAINAASASFNVSPSATAAANAVNLQLALEYARFLGASTGVLGGATVAYNTPGITQLSGGFPDSILKIYSNTGLVLGNNTILQGPSSATTAKNLLRNANASSNSVAVTSITFAKVAAPLSTIAIVTAPNHGFTVGSYVEIWYDTSNQANGIHPVVTVPDANTFTLMLYTADATMPPATGQHIRACLADANITLRGGTWDANGNSNATNNALHMIYFNKIAKLRTRDVTLANSIKYGMYLGNLFQSLIQDTYVASYSAGPQMVGPARDVLLDGLFGESQDDAWAFMVDNVNVEGYDMLSDPVSGTAANTSPTIALTNTAPFFGPSAATGTLTVTGGTLSAGVNKVSTITVNAVDVLGASVDWGTSNTATAAAIAAQINSFSSTPDYTAVSNGAQVIITAVATGIVPNGFAIATTVGGNVTIGIPVATMQGGSIGQAVHVKRQDTLAEVTAQPATISSISVGVSITLTVNASFTGAVFVYPVSSGSAGTLNSGDIVNCTTRHLRIQNNSGRTMLIDGGTSGVLRGIVVEDLKRSDTGGPAVAISVSNASATGTAIIDDITIRDISHPTQPDQNLIHIQPGVATATVAMKRLTVDGFAATWPTIKSDGTVFSGPSGHIVQITQATNWVIQDATVVNGVWTPDQVNGFSNMAVVAHEGNIVKTTVRDVTVIGSGGTAATNLAAKSVFGVLSAGGSACEHTLDNVKLNVPVGSLFNHGTAATGAYFNLVDCEASGGSNWATVSKGCKIEATGLRSLTGTSGVPLFNIFGAANYELVLSNLDAGNNPLATANFTSGSMNINATGLRNVNGTDCLLSYGVTNTLNLRSSDGSWFGDRTKFANLSGARIADPYNGGTYVNDGTAWKREIPVTQTVAFSATPALNCNLGNVVLLSTTLTAGVTWGAPSNVPPAGEKVTVVHTQDGTGGRAVAWNAAYIFPTAWSNAGNTLGLSSSITFVSDGTKLIAQGGNVWA